MQNQLDILANQYIESLRNVNKTTQRFVIPQF